MFAAAKFEKYNTSGSLDWRKHLTRRPASTQSPRKICVAPRSLCVDRFRSPMMSVPILSLRACPSDHVITFDRF